MNAASEPDSTAVLSVKIDNLTQTVEHLRDDLKAQSETYVRKDVYETKIQSLDREIVGIKVSAADAAKVAESRRPTGLAISALGVSVIVAIVTVVQALAK